MIPQRLIPRYQHIPSCPKFANGVMLLGIEV